MKINRSWFFIFAICFTIILVFYISMFAVFKKYLPIESASTTPANSTCSEEDSSISSANKLATLANLKKAFADDTIGIIRFYNKNEAIFLLQGSSYETDNDWFKVNCYIKNGLLFREENENEEEGIKLSNKDPNADQELFDDVDTIHEIEAERNVFFRFSEDQLEEKWYRRINGNVFCTRFYYDLEKDCLVAKIYKNKDFLYTACFTEGNDNIQIISSNDAPDSKYLQ